MRLSTLYMQPGVSTLTTPGFVYFMQGEDTRKIKIGWSSQPDARLVAVQAHSPDKIALLFSEPGTGTDEKTLHEKFDRWRSHGEWFYPGEDLKAHINERAGRDVFYKPKRRTVL